MGLDLATNHLGLGWSTVPGQKLLECRCLTFHLLGVQAKSDVKGIKCSVSFVCFISGWRSAVGDASCPHSGRRSTSVACAGASCRSAAHQSQPNVFFNARWTGMIWVGFGHQARIFLDVGARSTVGVSVLKFHMRRECFVTFRLGH